MRTRLTAPRLALAWAPALLYMALIWVLSSLALPDLPLDEVPLRDKGVHFVEYGALAFLLAHAALRTWPDHHPARTLALALLITVLWGLLDEIHQAFVPGRSAEALDLFADATGASCGALARQLFAWAARLRTPSSPLRSPELS